MQVTGGKALYRKMFVPQFQGTQGRAQVFRQTNRAARQSGFQLQRAQPQFILPRPVGRPGTEVKSVDVNPAAFNVVALAAVAFAEPATMTGYSELNDILQGAGVYQRVGTRVTIKSIHVKLQITGQTPATTNTLMRTILVYDRQTNGAAPAIATIFSDQIAGGGVATLFNAGLNIANRSRFSIIRDDIRAISFGSESIATYKTYAKGAWPVEYSASGGTIGDIATGAIYLIIASSNPGVALGVAISNSSVRLRYYD